VGEALECLGGNGYVEESIMPRLYREAPLYSIWEGSGNVICLDVLRALAKAPATVEALVQELRSASGGNRRLDSYIIQLESDLTGQIKRSLQNGGGEMEGQARRLTERLALGLQAVLTVRHSSTEMTDAFIASRLCGEHGNAFGTLPSGIDVTSILEPVQTGLELSLAS
jgi:putative acyl-CoA dehydrogenase